MKLLDNLKSLLEHPFVKSLANVFKMFKSSKSFYSIFYVLVVFTMQQAISWKYGTKISNAINDLSEAWYYGFIASILENGSIELVVLGVFLIIILSIVEVKKVNNQNIITDQPIPEYLSLMFEKNQIKIREIEELIKNTESYDEKLNLYDHLNDFFSEEKQIIDAIDQFKTTQPHHNQQTQSSIKVFAFISVILIALILFGNLNFVTSNIKGDNNIVVQNIIQSKSKVRDEIMQSKTQEDKQEQFELISQLTDTINNLAKTINHTQEENSELKDQYEQFKNIPQQFVNILNSEGSEQAEKYLEIMVKKYTNQPFISDLLRSYGIILRFKKKYNKAEKVYRRLLSHSNNTSKDLFEYAKVLEKLGKYEEAKKYYKEAISKTKSISEKYNIADKLTKLNNRLNFNIFTSNYQNSNSIFSNQYSDKELEKFLIMTTNKKQKIFILNILIILYKKQHNFQMTKQSYLRLLQYENNGKNLLSYALFLENHNEYNEALKVYKYLKKFNLDNKDEITMFYHLANIYKANNQYNQALKTYKKTLIRQKKLIKSNSNDYTTSLIYSDLGSFYQKHYQYQKALQIYDQALIIQRHLVEKNPKKYQLILSETLDNLGQVYKDQKQYKKALESYEEALTLRRNLVSNNQKSYTNYLAETLDNLGVLYSEQKQYIKALNSHEEALILRRALVQTDSKQYGIYLSQTLNYLGNFYKIQKQYEQALSVYEEALDLRQKSIQYNPKYRIYLAETLNDIGNFYRVQKQYEKALSVYQKALLIKRKLSKDHPNVYNNNLALTMKNLSSLYQITNKKKQAIKVHQEALLIQRKLADINPMAYELDYAEMLILGVDNYQQNKAYLKKAKKIILKDKYRNIHFSKKLLKWIKKIENRK